MVEYNSKYRKDITSKEACIVVSCKPSIQLLIKIQKEFPEINLEKTERTIKEIEKIMYKKNIFRAPSTVVSTAIYLANLNISQEIVCKMVNTTRPIITRLLKILGLNKFNIPLKKEISWNKKINGELMFCEQKTKTTKKPIYI